MNKLSNDSKKSMGSRILTAGLMALVGIPLSILGNWYIFVLVFFLAMVSIHEMLQAPGKKRYNIALMIVVFLFTLSFIYWQFIKDKGIFDAIINNQHFTLNTITVSTIGITVYFLLLFIISILDAKFTINDVCYLFAMSVFLGLAIYSSYFLRFFPSQDIYYGNQNLASCLLFFFTMVGAFMSDIGAYFVGVLFGRHRMNPRISPKKSWEGFVGGVIISIGFSFGFAAICSATGHDLIPGVLDFSGTNWLWILLISAIMPITGNIGDFLFSAIKRNFAIKDFGTIFPGHGGVLDRLDSLLVTNLVVAILVVMIANNWNFLI